MPDFIIRLKTSPVVHLILETKGFDELAEVKSAAAERWVAAVNADGRFGRWHYEMARAVSKVRAILDTGGRGHSCGIYSFDDDHIHRLALVAPVSRIMVRQIQSRSNAGTFTNGMPMTSSMGCGTWGGNITNENISLKHYMNVTWVSRPIAEDRPSELELFGEFYNSETF